jgi:hypothetical protein
VFVGCRRPAKVLVYDMTSGVHVGDFAIVLHGLRLAYSGLS